MGLSVSQSQYQKSQQQKKIKHFLEDEIMNKKNKESSQNVNQHYLNNKNKQNQDNEQAKANTQINSQVFEKKLTKSVLMTKKKVVNQNVEHSPIIKTYIQNDGGQKQQIDDKELQVNEQVKPIDQSITKNIQVKAIDLDKYDWQIPDNSQLGYLQKQKMKHANSITNLIQLSQYNKQSEVKQLKKVITRRDFIYQKIKTDKQTSQRTFGVFNLCQSNYDDVQYGITNCMTSQ